MCDLRVAAGRNGSSLYDVVCIRSSLSRSVSFCTCQVAPFSYPLPLDVANQLFSALFEGELSLNMVLMYAKPCNAKCLQQAGEATTKDNEPRIHLLIIFVRISSADFTHTFDYRRLGHSETSIPVQARYFQNTSSIAATVASSKSATTTWVGRKSSSK